MRIEHVLIENDISGDQILGAKSSDEHLQIMNIEVEHCSSCLARALEFDAQKAAACLLTLLYTDWLKYIIP